MHVEAARSQVVECGRLDAQVEHGDGSDALPHRRHRERLRCRDFCREVEARHRGAAAHEVELFPVAQLEVGAGEDAGTHGAGRTDVAGDGTRIDPADADDTLGDEVVVEAACGPEVRDDAGWLAHHVPGDPDAAGLHVFVVRTRVADVRRRHEHDLAGIGRVGQGFLIPGHAGREDRLTERTANRTVGATHITLAVFEDEDRGFETGHLTPPFRWSGLCPRPRLPRATARVPMPAGCLSRRRSATSVRRAR